MALLPFSTKDETGIQLFVSPKIRLGQTIKFIPYAERPGSPQESFANGVFKVRRVYDVPWHLRWHFMYAMLGDSARDQRGRICRRIPHGYSIRDFTSVYDLANNAVDPDLDKVEDTHRPTKPWLFASNIDHVEPIAFDGKDSMYILLTPQQMFGDIANAGKPPAQPPETPISGRNPARDNRSDEGIQRLRMVHEQLSSHEVAVVYKDVIREIKREEKRRIKSQTGTEAEQKKSYQAFLKKLKKERRKPIQANPAQFASPDYPSVVERAGTTPPNAFPEILFEDGGPFDNKLDPTAICKYKLARITVSYENVQYRIHQAKSSYYAGTEELGSDSFMSFYRLPTAEVLSLPMGAFRFVHKDPKLRYTVTGSNMRLESQEEIMLTWHSVPFVPDAVRAHIGKVNDDWFPISHLEMMDDDLFLDRNRRVFAAPGTLLLTNVELKPSKGFFSRRVYDINFKFKYFHATENGELAYAKDLFIKASDPCDPNDTKVVCQRMAKGHNFFLRYLFYNPRTGQPVTADESGQVPGSGDLFKYSVTQACALSGQTPSVFEKCSDPFSALNYTREYITHDGCPTGRPVYASANFDELFIPPDKMPDCDATTSTPLTPASGEEPAHMIFTSERMEAKHSRQFRTTINDHLKAQHIKVSITKPPTRNPRLRK